jgi:hypothetical protein
VSPSKFLLALGIAVDFRPEKVEGRPIASRSRSRQPGDHLAQPLARADDVRVAVHFKRDLIETLIAQNALDLTE